jgi:hypothetical protein
LDEVVVDALSWRVDWLVDAVLCAELADDCRLDWLADALADACPLPPEKLPLEAVPWRE